MQGRIAVGPLAEGGEFRLRLGLIRVHEEGTGVVGGRIACATGLAMHATELSQGAGVSGVLAESPAEFAVGPFEVALLRLEPAEFRGSLFRVRLGHGPGVDEVGRLRGPAILYHHGRHAVVGRLMSGIKCQGMAVHLFGGQVISLLVHGGCDVEGVVGAVGAVHQGPLELTAGLCVVAPLVEGLASVVHGPAVDGGDRAAPAERGRDGHPQDSGRAEYPTGNGPDDGGGESRGHK